MIRRRMTVLAVITVVAILCCVTAAAAQTVTHEVARGDTLWLLAQRYGTTVREIQANNGLNGDELYPGMKLVISGVPATATGKAEAIPWAQADRIFVRGAVARVTDVRTGLSWSVKRRGGTRHADVEPLTREDTALMKRAYGGSWSWARRPIVVEAAERRIAASMNGMPHGRQSITNGFPGHHCIHFLGSSTHAGKRIDPAHQAAVREAIGH